MHANDLISWCMVMLPIMMSPGPANVATASVTASHGVRAAATFVSGIMTTNLIVVTLMGMGMGALYAKYHSIFSLFEHLGALYIIYLGCCILTSAIEHSQSDGNKTLLKYKDGFFLQLLNAKFYPTLFMMYSIFIDDSTSTRMEVVGLGARFILAATFSYCVWMCIGAVLAQRRGPVANWIQRYGFGSMLTLAGVRLFFH